MYIRFVSSNKIPGTRARYGLLRGREFIMKDSYSFHSSEEDMCLEFNKMEQIYKNIFTKLGLDFVIVEADSGNIGGSKSKEFHVLADIGEDTLYVCNNCKKGFNIEVIEKQENIETCSCCGCVDDNNRKTQENFVCVKCNFSLNRDKNRSKNIFIKGFNSLQRKVKSK